MSVAVALAQARVLMLEAKVARVLIAAADSLVSWPTLSDYERRDRVLTARNSNGFMPGEAAGALLVGESRDGSGQLVCTGIGFADTANDIFLAE